MRNILLLTCAAILAELGFPQPTNAVDLVRDGKPAATIVISSQSTDKAPRNKRRLVASDRMAATTLVKWVIKMTDVELPVRDTAPPDGAVVYIGSAAVGAGLTLDDIECPSSEGMRIRCDDQTLLIAGQNETATVRAVCRLLEELGCRYFVDHAIGEVYPRTKTLRVGDLNITEQPGFAMRKIWGSRWTGQTLWKIWNGAGGVQMATGHSWGKYVADNLFDEHSEYFQFREGQRNINDWYCTSNQQLRQVFADGVIASIRSGTVHPSISPPDGRGYCQCNACRGQDDPNSIEPSSGTVSITNRYLDFYQTIGKRVAQEFPDSILSFYCYADYTQAPTSGIKLPDNLCAWIAPIRYCRFHRVAHPDCPSRQQLDQLVDGWSAAASRIGYRTYNYNLAECCVPLSLMSVWRHDIPYLSRKGCIGINLETLANWQIYGPHMYLSIRLAYAPDADVDAMMDDYFDKFYGPGAAPAMKRYWTDIDRAFVNMNCHTGSFYALHLVYTSEFLNRCQKLLDQASQAAAHDKTYSARVQMAREGLQNAAQYIAVRDAMNRGDFPAARKVYGNLLARSQKNAESGLGDHYTVNYVKRFVGRHVEAGAAACSDPNRFAAVLPDRWRLMYDEQDRGISKGFLQPEFDDTAWPTVATYSNPLDAQGLPDRKTIMWYRTAFDVPDTGNAESLFFTEVDGDATVYINGQEVGSSEKKRTPFSVEIADAVVEGRNVVAVRIDHTKITDLFLGGIIRPVLLIEGH